MPPFSPFETRRRLLAMRTEETLTFGRLTVRLFASATRKRWQICGGGVTQTYSYARHPEYNWIESRYAPGSFDEALAKTITYIMQHYQDAAPSRVCPTCGGIPPSSRAVYCSTKCREKAWRWRRKTA